MPDLGVRRAIQISDPATRPSEHPTPKSTEVAPYCFPKWLQRPIPSDPLLPLVIDRRDWEQEHDRTRARRSVTVGASLPLAGGYGSHGLKLHR